MAEFAPTPGITEALRGTFSAPIDTTNPKGKPVTKRYRTQGSGQWHIPHVGELGTAAGIMHHSLLTDRYAVTHSSGFLVAHRRGLITIPDGYTPPNPQAIADADVVYHGGRIAGEEARQNPETVDWLLGSEEGARRRSISYEALSLEFIEGKIPPDAFAIASAKGRSPNVDPDVYKSYSYLISNWADHRSTSEWQPLAPRMAVFLRTNYFDPSQVTEDLEAALLSTVSDIVDRQRQHRLEDTAPVSFAEAEDSILGLGAKETAARGGNRGLIIEYLLRDPITEAELKLAGTNPDAPVPMPAWEKQLRRDYVASAAGEFMPLIAGSTEVEIDAALPKTEWWSQIAREIYNAHPERRTPQIPVYPAPATT